MENIVYNTVMSNLLISGTKACAVIPRELMSVDPAYPERVELSLALYLQDYLVSLGEPKQFNEKGKKIS